MNHQLMFASLVFLFLTAPARADRCYSQQEGYKECSNGCCGASDKLCCPSTALVVSLSVGGGLLAVTLTTVGVCWVCGCHEKLRPNTGATSRPRGRERGRNSRHRSRRPRVVHPVAPPDYMTATQGPTGLQPGLVHPLPIPFTPPPPYSEAATPPPPQPTHQSSNPGTSGVDRLAISGQQNIFNPTPVEG